MNRESTYQVSYQIIHTEGVSIGSSFNKSVKAALKEARSQAWEDHDSICPSNWADVWLTITKGGKTIFDNFALIHQL